MRQYYEHMFNCIMILLIEKCKDVVYAKEIKS